MKTAFLLFAISVLVGCGGSEYQLVPVSGTVTYDGEPLNGADVVFAPMESEGVIDVGPISVGTTDSSGNYTLLTTKGLEGAMVTKHRVSIGFKGINETEVSRKVDEAYRKNRSMSEREMLAIEQKVRAAMKKELKGEINVPKSYNKNTRLRFEVSGPSENADFALNSEGSLTAEQP